MQPPSRRSDPTRTARAGTFQNLEPIGAQINDGTAQIEGASFINITAEAGEDAALTVAGTGRAVVFGTTFENTMGGSDVIAVDAAAEVFLSDDAAASVDPAGEGSVRSLVGSPAAAGGAAFVVYQQARSLAAPAACLLQRKDMIAKHQCALHSN